MHGPLSVLHFAAHLDTWDVLHGASIWHGSRFRRAAEEGLRDLEHCQHVGIRGGIYDPSGLDDDREAGFEIIRSEVFQERTMQSIVDQIRERLGTGPVLSIDIDVLDPSQAPGTGTPEVAGITTREFFAVLRQLRGLDIVGGRRGRSRNGLRRRRCDRARCGPAWELLTLIGLAGRSAEALGAR